MPGQTFQVLQCFSCRTYQVQQKKKVNKWACKMCGEKQSIKKIYGEGSGADCRVHVQKLNRLRGEMDSSMVIQKPAQKCSTDVVLDAGNMDRQTDGIPVNQVQICKASKWGEYCEEGEEEGEEEGTGGEELWTTEREHYNNYRKRKKNTYDYGQTQPYKSKKRWEHHSQLKDLPESNAAPSQDTLMIHKRLEDTRGATDWSEDIQSTRRSHHDLHSVAMSHQDLHSTGRVQNPSAQWRQQPSGISQSHLSLRKDSADQRLSEWTSGGQESNVNNMSLNLRAGKDIASLNGSESNQGEVNRKPISSGVVNTKSKWATFIEEKDESEDSEGDYPLNCYSSYQGNVAEHQSQEETTPAQGETTHFIKEDKSLAQGGETTKTNQREVTLSMQEEAPLYSVLPKSNKLVSRSFYEDENKSPTDMKCKGQQQSQKMSNLIISKRLVSGHHSNDNTKRIILGQPVQQCGQPYSCLEPGTCADKNAGHSVNNIKQASTSLFSLGDVDEEDLDLDLQF